MFGWFPTQQAQERLGKLSYKCQPAGAKTGHFAIFFKPSLLIESTDSMVESTDSMIINFAESADLSSRDR